MRLLRSVSRASTRCSSVSRWHFFLCLDCCAEQRFFSRLRCLFWLGSCVADTSLIPDFACEDDVMIAGALIGCEGGALEKLEDDALKRWAREEAACRFRRVSLPTRQRG